MTPTTGTAVIIIVAFLLPGFVTVLIQERTFRSAEETTPLDRLLLIVWYSAWSYVLLAAVAVIFRVHKHDVVTIYNDYKNEPSELFWRGALVVLVPSLLIAEATRRWAGWSRREAVLKKVGINGRHTQPTGWDHFFRRGRDCMVRVTFADGRRVLGYYGPKSFAAYSKDGGDLLLEKLYTPNDPENQWSGLRLPRFRDSGSRPLMPSVSSSTLRWMAERPKSTSPTAGMKKEGGHAAPKSTTKNPTPPPPPPPKKDK